MTLYLLEESQPENVTQLDEGGVQNDEIFGDVFYDWPEIKIYAKFKNKKTIIWGKNNKASAGGVHK